MSASEKLKELNVQLGGEDADVGIPLPQIVAVVEAAEKLRNLGTGESELVATVALDRALAALDEALS
jgi:hypothetical protein